MSSGEMEVLRLRPHHILCNRFLPLDGLNRGEEFARVVQEIKELTESAGEQIIVVTEGPDQLCCRCPDYRNDRCGNPLGDEEKVRRWDAKVLDGLGIACGEEMTATALLALVREKAPLDFCRERCGWKSFCGVALID